ncbi:MAG: CoA-binding protein, partial [Sneathiella sp.]
QRIVDLGRETGVRIVGPNCVGLVNTTLGAGLNFMPGFYKTKLIDGPISIISQSGGLGYTLFQGMERGAGISKYLASGNSCDVDVCDYISYLADDPGTKVIVCLLEGVKDGARFVEAAQKAYDRGKPLLVYKMGVGELSRKTAMSHTGTMVGSREAFDAAIAKTGAVAIKRLDGLLEAANFFARAGAPRSGKGVGVMATSGGAAVVTADKAEEHGVVLPPLAKTTAEKLSKIVPGFGAVANPSDLTAEVLKTKESFIGCFDAFAEDPSFDAIIVPLVFASPESSGTRTPIMCEMARRTGLPIVGIWMNDWLEGPGSEVLDADTRACIFRSTDRCFETIALWQEWHRRRKLPKEKKIQGRLSPTSATDNAKKIIGAMKPGEKSLDETKAKQLLAEYGIAPLKEAFAATPDDAVREARAIGFPVAVKIVSPDILHKTEVGGVRLGLPDEGALRAAVEEMISAVSAKLPDARIDGVVVQEMAPDGVELVVGATIDEQFGPLIAVGLGGTMVEILQDTAVRLAPLTPADVGEMLAGLKCYPLLTGFRGSKSVNLEAVTDLIVRFSEFVSDLPDYITEVDINPVIATTERAVCVDALIAVNLKG